MPHPTPDAPMLQAQQRVFLDDLLGQAPQSAEQRAAMLRRPSQDDVEARFHIYVSGLPGRVAEALENDFPAVARILGPGPLRSLAARYVAAHPPRSYDLGRAGDHLAVFLAADPLAEQLPFLADLARYEWAIAEAFVAADATPVAWADLAALPAGKVADLRFLPLPGSTLVRSRWPLRALRATREVPDEQVSVDVGQQPCLILVHRKGLEAVSRDLGEPAARLLEALAQGATLAEATMPGGEDTAVAALRRLVEWGCLTSPGRDGRWNDRVPSVEPPPVGKIKIRRK